MSEKIVLSLKGRRGDQPWFVVHAASDAEAKDLLGASFSDADEAFRNGGDLVQGFIAADYQYKNRLDKADSYYAEKALHDAGAVQQAAPQEAPPEDRYQAPQQSRYDNQQGNGYQQSAPQQRSYGAGAAAPSNDKTCKHGIMKHNSGEKNGKAWEGWFCPADRNAPDKCDPVWPKKSYGR